jgi:hypothetical protein
VLVESPVGGFALANEVSGNCALLNVPCHLWFAWGLPAFFGKPVLRDLQVPGKGVQGSIVGELGTKVSSRFDVTSIQSNADYLVNGTPLRVCDNVQCKTSGPLPIGSGTQRWNPPPLKEHDSSSLGGTLLAKPIPPGLYGPIFKGGTVQANHTAPLKQNQTAEWVDQALTTDGLRWKAKLAESPSRKRARPCLTPEIAVCGPITVTPSSARVGQVVTIRGRTVGKVFAVPPFILMYTVTMIRRPRKEEGGNWWCPPRTAGGPQQGNSTTGPLGVAVVAELGTHHSPQGGFKWKVTFRVPTSLTSTTTNGNSIKIPTPKGIYRFVMVYAPVEACAPGPLNLGSLAIT